MITVAILINKHCIAKVSAKRVDMENGVGLYELEDGTTITHEYAKGAKPLALKMVELMDVPSLEEQYEKLHKELMEKVANQLKDF